MLLTECLCGAKRHKVVDVENAGDTIRVARCGCGVERLISDLTPLDIDLYYAGDYHSDGQRHHNVTPYTQRYDNDRATAKIRLAAWKEELEPRGCWRSNLRILDVGAANGALVDVANQLGYTAIGVEPDPRFTREPVIFCGGVLDVGRGHDLVTYLDVLEHVVNPVEELEHAATRVGPGGVLLIDVPDVAVHEGRKHYKREHLWYFTTRSLSMIARRVGLRLITQDFPIPGKMVTYLCNESLS